MDSLGLAETAWKALAARRWRDRQRYKMSAAAVRPEMRQRTRRDNVSVHVQVRSGDAARRPAWNDTDDPKAVIHEPHDTSLGGRFRPAGRQ